MGSKQSLWLLVRLLGSQQLQVQAIDKNAEYITQLNASAITSSSVYSADYALANIQTEDPEQHFATADADTNQWVRIELQPQRIVRGIYIATYEPSMNSGLFKVYFNSIETIGEVTATQSGYCGTHNNVGIDAAGGAFNCKNHYYKRFIWIYCEQTCQPQLALGMVRAWVYNILSAIDGAQVYIPDYFSGFLAIGSSYSNGTPHSDSDFQYLIKQKQISKSDNRMEIVLNPASEDYVWLGLSLSKPAFINQVMWQGADKNGLSVHVSDAEVSSQFSASDFSDTQRWCDDFISAQFTNSENGDCKRIGKHLSFVFQSDRLEVEKIIVTGQWLNEYPVQVESKNYLEYCIEFTEADQVINIPAPTLKPDAASLYPNDFPDYVAGQNYDFSGEGVTAWLQDQSMHDGTFRAQPDNYWFNNFYGEHPQTIWVEVQLEPYYNSAQRFVWLGTFPIYFNNKFDEIGTQCSPDLTPLPSEEASDSCTTSQLIQPARIDTLQTRVGEQPVYYTFPEVQDTQSLQDGDATGLSKCGPRVYSLTKGGTFLAQNKRELTLQTDNPEDIGQQIAEMQVSLADYPDVAPITVDIPVFIQECLIQELANPGDVVISPINQVLELPFKTSLDMPLYEPSPLCGYSNSDVYYQLSTQAGQKAPQWVQINPRTHQIDIEIEDDATLYGKKFVFKLTATFANLFTDTQTFRVNIAEKEAGEQVENESQDPEESQNEQEITGGLDSTPGMGGLGSSNADGDDNEEKEIEGTEEVLSMDQVNTWDGWKVLLLQLGLDFELPKPRTDDPNYKPTPPVVSLGTIDAYGKVTIKFSKPVFMIEDVTTRTIGKRMLASKAFLEVQVEAGGDFSDPALLGFSTKSTWPDDQTIILELAWTNPTAVSASQPEDTITVTFNGPFFDKEDGLPLEKTNIKLTKVLPPQVVPGTLTDAVAAAGDTLQAGSTTMLAGNAVMNIFLQGSLNQVWGMINNLQTIIHAPLINIQFPGNAFMLYEVMITVATFDILPSDVFLPAMFPNLDQEEAFSDKFERLGYETQYIIMNMGTMFLVFCLNSLLLFVYCLLWLCNSRFKVARVLSRKISRVMFFRWQIIFIQEAYLDLFLAASINFFSFDGFWNTFDDVFNNLLTLVIAAQLVVLPIFIVAFIVPNFRLLKKSSFMEKYGAVYDMVNLKQKSRSVLLWPIFFIGRRILFALGVVFLLDYPTLQIYLFIFPTLAVLMMVGLAEPLQTPFENKSEVYNNFTILVLSYCLLCFTEFVPVPDMRYNMGYLMILLTVQNIVVSLVFIASDPVRMIKLRIRRCRIQRAYRKKMGIKSESFSLRKLNTKAWISQKFRSMRQSFYEEDGEAAGDQQVDKKSGANLESNTSKLQLHLSMIVEEEENQDADVQRYAVLQDINQANLQIVEEKVANSLHLNKTRQLEPKSSHFKALGSLQDKARKMSSQFSRHQINLDRETTNPSPDLFHPEHDISSASVTSESDPFSSQSSIPPSRGSPSSLASPSSQSSIPVPEQSPPEKLPTPRPVKPTQLTETQSTLIQTIQERLKTKQKAFERLSKQRTERKRSPMQAADSPPLTKVRIDQGAKEQEESEPTDAYASFLSKFKKNQQKKEEEEKKKKQDAEREVERKRKKKQELARTKAEFFEAQKNKVIDTSGTNLLLDVHRSSRNQAKKQHAKTQRGRFLDRVQLEDEEHSIKRNNLNLDMAKIPMPNTQQKKQTLIVASNVQMKEQQPSRSKFEVFTSDSSSSSESSVDQAEVERYKRMPLRDWPQKLRDKQTRKQMQSSIQAAAVQPKQVRKEPAKPIQRDASQTKDSELVAAVNRIKRLMNIKNPQAPIP